MVLSNHAYYEVTLKILLKQEDKILVLTTHDGFLDFPGGRVDVSEVDLPFIEVLKREVKEELGDKIEFKVGDLAFVAKRQYTKNGQVFRTLAIFYEAEFMGGEISLSNEHEIKEWVKPAVLLSRDNKYMTSDEEIQLITYFK